MKLQITNKAAQVLMSTFNKGSYKITKIVTSSKEYSGLELEYLNNIDVKERFNPTKVYVTNGYGCVEGIINNRNVTTMYKLNTIGVYAQVVNPGLDEEGKPIGAAGEEFLFGIVKLDIPVKIEPYSKRNIKIDFKGTFTLSPTENVFIKDI